MAKKILVICTSMRSRSNSEMLADSFIEGAKASGNTVEKVTLKGKTINFCKGCFSCQKTGKCVIADSAPAITEKIRQAEVIVWASPIYYYSVSGQMKTLIDRANPLYVSEYAFRDVYFLSAATEDEKDTDDRALRTVEGWIACFPKARLAGKVFAGGVTDQGEIAGHKALQEAFAMGKAIA